MKRPTTNFTMIELLVVLSCTSVLMCLLISALNQAKIVVEEKSCQDKERQLGIILSIYQIDHKGFPKPAGPTPYGSNYYWTGKLYNAGLLEVTEPLYWGALKTNCDLLACSAMDDEPITYGFAMNPTLAKLMGVPDSPNHQLRRETSVIPSMISKPSERLLLGESSNLIIEGGTVAYAPGKFAWYPHDSKMNALFLDGHAEELQQFEMSHYAVMAPIFGWKE